MRRWTLVLSNLLTALVVLALGSVAIGAAPTLVTIIQGGLALSASNGLPVNVVAGGSGGGPVTMASGAVASGAYASGSIASGAVASGAVASGAYAAGSIGSGAVASGAVASGAYASGAISDGADVTQGAKGDATCGTATGTCTLVQLLKYLNANGIITTGTAGAPSATVLSTQGAAAMTPLLTSQTAAITPTFETGNSTGTTGAVVGTLATAVGKTTYICGFDVSAIGGTATVGPITVAGLITSSMVFQLGSLAAGNTLPVTFNPCIPASATNTTITITTTADGTASAVDVNSWGYQQ